MKTAVTMLSPNEPITESSNIQAARKAAKAAMEAEKKFTLSGVN